MEKNDNIINCFESGTQINVSDIFYHQVEEKLSQIDGVVNVKAFHKDKQVKIEFDSTKTDLKTIKSNIIESGYKLLIE